MMLWSFAVGLTVDIFSNTLGMNAAAATCLAFCRTSLIRLVTLRDVDEGFRPGIRSLGFSAFLRYALFSSVIFCTLLLLMDTFSFFNPVRLVLKIVTSTVATLLCILCAEWMGRTKA